MPGEEYPRCFECAKPLRGWGLAPCELHWARFIRRIFRKKYPGVYPPLVLSRIVDQAEAVVVLRGRDHRGSPSEVPPPEHFPRERPGFVVPQSSTSRLPKGFTMSCVVCGKVLGAAELRGHEVREHTDHVYRCSCAQRFASSQDLRRHSRATGHAISAVYRLPGEESFEIVPHVEPSVGARAQSRASHGRSSTDGEEAAAGITPEGAGCRSPRLLPARRGRGRQGGADRSATVASGRDQAIESGACAADGK